MHGPGAPHSRQLKVVCQQCNFGWMSDIQKVAKDQLIPLIRGEWPVFDVASMRAICAWAAMVTMTLEYVHPQTVAITQEERSDFMANGFPGENWRICIGLVDGGESFGSFWHRAAEQIKDTSYPLTNKANVQTTTIYIGRAFIHVISGPLEIMPEPVGYAYNLGIRRFWPIPNEPPAKPLIFTSDGFNRVATFYWTLFGLSPQLHFGHLI